MQLNDFLKIVEPLIGDGLTDIRYHHFSYPPTLPFAAYFEVDTSFFMTDDQTVFEDGVVRFEVYTETKDQELEEKIQDLLQGLPWERQPSEWLESENCYLTVYYIY